MSLFGKNTPREAEGDKGRTLPVEPAPSPRFEPTAHRTEAKAAVIGPHVKIQGELSGDEDIVIEGRVDGKISVSKSLRVGNSAQINAEVKAQSIVIAGKVVGNVTAVDRVELLASGQLEGNIRAPKIVIAEGAQFKGSVDMGAKSGAPDTGSTQKAPMPPPAAPAPGPGR